MRCKPCVSVITGLLVITTAHANLIWQIGKADQSAKEFQYGPAGYANFDRDGLFIVGRSDPKQDWPYVHPGPSDTWAGGRSHAFTIFFGLKKTPRESCNLMVGFVDTHPERPPRFAVSCNGQQVGDCRTPVGGSDASILGKGGGKAYRMTVQIPGSVLKTGLNELVIDNVELSWAVYDWIGFAGPTEAELQPLRGAVIRSVQVSPWLVKHGNRAVQDVSVDLLRFDDLESVVVEAGDVQTACPRDGTVTLHLPAANEPHTLTVRVTQGNTLLDAREILRQPGAFREPVDWVDPLIGTSTSRWMLYPGPSMPFGMVKLSPDNQGEDPSRVIWKAGYEYTIENIMGFSHIHSWTMGGLLTMPMTGPLHTKPGPERDPDAGYRSRFRHDTEIARPGYYSVMLDDYQIKAELTCTVRAGFQRYTFPESRESRILVDLLTPTEYGKQVLGAEVQKTSDREIVGSVEMVSGNWAKYQHYTLYFVARTDRPFEAMGGWVGNVISRDITDIEGQGDVGVFLDFKTRAGEIIQLQTGISLVSIEQARLNLDTEMKPYAWDFDACRKAARDVWNQLLGRVQIEGARAVDHTKFYTNLYRAYCARTIWSDVNGKYTDMYEKLQQVPDPDSPVYGCDAFWNTFWNLNQLWTLLTPETSDKWVRSLLEIYDKGGWLPKGPTGIEYSSIMVASHEIPLMVAAYQHGIRGYDVDKAFQAMVQCQTTPGQAHPGGGYVGNRQLTPYLKFGYVPMGQGSASNTLEYAYDDWCVAQMAKALGREKEYAEFSKRGESWRNLFDTETGFMRARTPDGKWQTPFDPFGNAGGWVEGNPWQYTWFVPQNVQGLVKLMGRERFVNRLNEGLAKSAKYDFNAPGDRMASVPINHGNQPSMQVAWLFNYARSPWLTQKWVRAILDQYYGDDPIDGWPGDEDQGQGGAWYVMSALGLFQVDGGCRIDPIYELGSPLFERASIRLDTDYFKGQQFVIETRHNAPDNVYIQSATLNGKPLTRPWFHATELFKGGTLIVELGPTPNKAWGSGADDVPPRP